MFRKRWKKNKKKQEEELEAGGGATKKKIQLRMMDESKETIANPLTHDDGNAATVELRGSELNKRCEMLLDMLSENDFFSFF